MLLLTFKIQGLIYSTFLYPRREQFWDNLDGTHILLIPSKHLATAPRPNSTATISLPHLDARDNFIARFFKSRPTNFSDCHKKKINPRCVSELEISNFQKHQSLSLTLRNSQILICSRYFKPLQTLKKSPFSFDFFHLLPSIFMCLIKS